MPHHLLIADDSVTIQRVIKLTFADEDVDVVAVGDGSQALAAIDQAPPDIVLADVEMPGCSGYDVARHVRSSPRLSHIPVVLLTGAFEPIDEARASAAGCDGVLAKPFEPQAVLSRVRELLSKPRSARSMPAPSATPAPAVAIPVEPIPVPVTAPVAAAVATPLPVTPHLATQPEPLSMPQAAALQEPVVVPMPAVQFQKPAQDLDAYFERLDQAFADLATTPRAAAPAPPPPAMPVRDLDSLAASFAAPPIEPTAPMPSVSRPAAPLSFSARGPRERPADPMPEPPSVDLASVTSIALPAPMSPPPDVPVPELSGSVRSSRPGVRSLVEAFQGLIAEEAQQQIVPPPPGPRLVTSEGDDPARGPGVPSTAAFAGSVADAPAPVAATLSDETIDRIATRVIERLASQLADGNASDLVSRIAERVVRQEIDQIKRRL